MTLEVRGYVARYETVYPGGLEGHGRWKQAAGSFDLSGPINLLFGHDHRHVYASTASVLAASRGTLRLWEDGYGLACSFDLVERAGLPLLGDIFGGRVQAMSAGAADAAEWRMEIIDGEPVTVVTRFANMTEVSVVHEGLDPAARCWPAERDPWSMPREMRIMAQQWQAGKLLREAAERRARVEMAARKGQPKRRFPKACAACWTARTPSGGAGTTPRRRG
jgi:phage head maturation protease